MWTRLPLQRCQQLAGMTVSVDVSETVIVGVSVPVGVVLQMKERTKTMKKKERKPRESRQRWRRQRRRGRRGWSGVRDAGRRTSEAENRRESREKTR
jgi:hypothetical protein